MSDAKDVKWEPRVLVVDDEEAIRVFLERCLKKHGLHVTTSSGVADARDRLSVVGFDLVISDLRMPDGDGLEILRGLREDNKSTPFLVMTGFGSIKNAIEAVRAGAADYITKPFEREEMLEAVDAALANARLRQENRLLRELLDEGARFEGIVGTSPPMRELYRLIDEVAPREGCVLITGESGVGKELVARAVHRRSSRSAGPFVAFHCAAVPSNLLSAELFGVEKGAFTGAKSSRKGAVGRARGGTLFLDEIGDLPLDVQPLLLRLLEGGDIVRVGGSEEDATDVRIVAATNRDLSEDCGDLREDLFYRLNVFPLHVPPLRSRRSDVSELLEFFLDRDAPDGPVLSLEAQASLESYDWPGNVRQLENIVARMLARSTTQLLLPEDVPDECREPARDILESAADPQHPEPFKAAVARFERGYLTRLLSATGGNISEAARRAEVSRPTLHARLARYSIDAARFQ